MIDSYEKIKELGLFARCSECDSITNIAHAYFIKDTLTLCESCFRRDKSLHGKKKHASM